MPLAAEELVVVRSWVGESPTDQDLHDMFDRLGSADAVVTESLQQQYLALMQQPSSLSLPSGLSITITQNLTSMQAWIKKWENSGGTGLEQTTGVGFAKLYRPDRR